MRNKQLSVYSNEWKNSFIKENVEKIKEAVIKFNDIPKSDIYIRNKEDSVLSIASTGKGLNVWDSSFKNSDPFKSFLKDFKMVESEKRVKRLAVFDTETTSQYNCYIVSIAIVILNIETMQIEDEYYTLVNPEVDIDPQAQAVHKISQEDVANEKTFAQLKDEINALFEKADIICGQNIENFDLRVMEREYDRLDIFNPLLDMPVFDTMVMSKQIVNTTDIRGKIKNPTVEEIMNHFDIKQPAGMYHNALTDTKACAEIVKKLFAHEFE